jgi:pantetheine-phosphate adenylyltransferase
MSKVIYSGTFDPITNGHLDIIRRALKIFDEVIVAIAVSHTKNPMFSIEKRVKLAQQATSNLSNVIVKSFDTLLVDFAKEQQTNHIVRGIRAVSDFEFELQMGYANSSLNSELDTVYLMPTLQNAFVSSSIVRELIRFGGDYSHLIPNEIKNELFIAE